jgi:hypothetical protein
MANISLRVDGDLLEDVDEALSEEESRSQFLRRAARVEASRRGVRPEPPEASTRVDDLRDDLDDLDDRVSALEDATLLDRIFKSR